MLLNRYLLKITPIYKGTITAFVRKPQRIKLKITPIYKGTITVQHEIIVKVELKITPIYKGTITVIVVEIHNPIIKDYPDL